MFQTPYTINHPGGVEVIDLGDYSTATSFQLDTTADATWGLIGNGSWTWLDTAVNQTHSVIDIPANTTAAKLVLTGHITAPQFSGDVFGTGAFTGTVAPIVDIPPCAAVPEPESVVMLAAGLAILWFKRSRLARFAS